MLLSILAILFVFGLIVIVHEWGHMTAAKLCGVAVPDFALGMGPSLFSFRRGGTRYHICAFPIGGFVRIAGLEGDDALPKTRKELARLTRDEPGLEDEAYKVVEAARDEFLQAGTDAPDAPNAIGSGGLITGGMEVDSRTWRDINGWQKAFILIGGPLMNFILAFVIVFLMGFVGFPQNAVLIESVEPGSPAQEAGLKVGDLVTAVDGQRVINAKQFSAVVHSRNNQSIPLEVQRDGETLTIQATPHAMGEFNEGRVSLGLVLNESSYSTNQIDIIQPKSIADKRLQTEAGGSILLRVGDQVTAVNGKPVQNGWDVLRALTPFDFNTGLPVSTEGRQVKLTVLQESGAEHVITLPEDTTPLSLGLQFRPELQRLPLRESLSRSLQDAQAYMLGMVYSLKMVFTPEGMKTISGPIGIVRMIGQSAKAGLYTFLFILLLINLNLGLINLFPLPALDGGRLVFVALNGLGVRITEKREALVHATGMIVLLGLILTITFGDVLAWLTR